MTHEVAAADIYADPLSYPGRPAEVSGVLAGGFFVEGATPDSTGRRPVLAVGSNASPAQIRRKLATLPRPTVVPFSKVAVRNLVAGVSAHVSTPGYVPAAPVEVAGEVSNMVVVWLDEDQLRVIDDTEPNYRRLPLDPERFPVRSADTSTMLGSCDAYVSLRGHLVHDNTSPRRLTPQPDLIRSLLHASAALRSLAGETPEEFVATMRRRPAALAQCPELFVAEGWVCTQSVR